MKKIIFTVLVFGILFLAACGQTQNTGSTSGSGFSGNLAQAISSGKSMKCTMDTQGVKLDTYIKGKKARSESLIQGMKSITILDENNCAWVWSESSTQGTKICTDAKTTGNNQQVSGSNIDPNIKVSCNEMMLEDSLFMPPINIKFTDLNQMMKNVPGA